MPLLGLRHTVKFKLYSRQCSEIYLQPTLGSGPSFPFLGSFFSILGLRAKSSSHSCLTLMMGAVSCLWWSLSVSRLHRVSCLVIMNVSITFSLIAQPFFLSLHKSLQSYCLIHSCLYVYSGTLYSGHIVNQISMFQLTKRSSRNQYSFFSWYLGITGTHFSYESL